MMAKQQLPLKEVSISELFMSEEQHVYEIPIYQRNYAWEKDEIAALIQDVFDAYQESPHKVYYIGTLVSFQKEDRVFEIIDGQQRLTTIRLILGVMGKNCWSRLTYRARKRSDRTLRALLEENEKTVVANTEKDTGIENGFQYARTALDEIVSPQEKPAFEKFFCSQVHIIHYSVPKDIDLNHYFEIMNSRGEQLEKHEIIKADLMGKLDEKQRKLFHCIWESCCEMGTYVQQSRFWTEQQQKQIFGNELRRFEPKCFDDLLNDSRKQEDEEASVQGSISIAELLEPGSMKTDLSKDDADKHKDVFQPIIDLPNFLLIVLKLQRMFQNGFDPQEFQLDDKELLHEFRKTEMAADDVKTFAYLLLKARFLLDNYIVHHSDEEDTEDSNPWMLQIYQKDAHSKEAGPQNLCDGKTDGLLQKKLVHLLSMFEVTFTARQRKNYLFYCLLYLMEQQEINCGEYAAFLEELADRYFFEVYLDSQQLNEKHIPRPRSFDSVVLEGTQLRRAVVKRTDAAEFTAIYGDGSREYDGGIVPLFIFNYLDYQLWKLYALQLRGEDTKENSRERMAFFTHLGCGDFGLKAFDRFYFSRTRQSLEHYYPQANVSDDGKDPNRNEINCLGNYAMIGSDANSSGSNWDPPTKNKHYLDESRKISRVSVASLKFRIMMQICEDKQSWDYEDIKNHGIVKKCAVRKHTNSEIDRYQAAW